MTLVESCTLINPRSMVTGLDGKTSYTLQYRIVSSSKLKFSGLVRAAAQSGTPNPLPTEYDVLTASVTGGVYTDPTAYCVSVDLRQDNADEQRLWMATVVFTQLPKNKTPDDAVANPLARPSKSWTETIEEVAPTNEYYDATSGAKKLLRNGAGQEFIDPVMQERSYPVLVIQKNIAALATIIAWNLEFEASVNELLYQGGAPRTVRFMPIQSGQLTYESGVAFYPAVVRFVYKPETWDRRIVNQGFHYRDATNKLKRSQDDDKEDTVEPVLLLPDGKKAPLDALGQPVNHEDSILVRNTRPVKDFTSLGF